MQQTGIEQEKNNNLTAFSISIVIYGAFLILLYFLELMYQPQIEDISGDSVNFGMDLIGSGNINTTNKANPSPNNYDVEPPKETKVEKPQPKVVEKTVPPVTEKVKPVKVKTAPEKIVTTKDEKAPVTVRENEKDSKVTKTVPKTTQPVETKAKPVPNPAPPQTKQPERKVDENSTMKRGGGSSNGTSGTRTGVGGASDGDDKSGVGNKGRPDGSTDAVKFEGKGGRGSGGGGGDGVSLTGFGGWSKRKMSIPQDASNETGKIVFSITVDDTGNVLNITRASGTTISSNTVINYYKEYIRNNLSRYLIAEGSPPPKATGTITINIEN